MAQLKNRRKENVAGAFYVDSSCIDCDTCRWLAPDTFGRAGEQSYVHQQPQNDEVTLQALQAMMACPTTSIGTQEKSSLIVTARDMFPLHIDGPVYYCGYHSAHSYGAASYLIQHPDGNILVDSPRFNGPLVKGIEKLGGIRYMFLTHRDDIADHRHFAEVFGCERIMLKDDIEERWDDIEQQIDGDKPHHIYDDVCIIPSPGHTKGHAVLLAFGKYLFTGDHLAWSARLKQLYAFRNHCWYDWEEQIQSMEKLLDFPFQWVLPGHGRRFQSDDTASMHEALQVCIDWMKSED